MLRYRRAAGVTHEVLNGHAVLIDPATENLLTLNQVGTLVWQHLDDARSCEELATTLLPTLAGVSAEQLELDIASFMSELLAASLVVVDDEDR